MARAAVCDKHDMMAKSLAAQTNRLERCTCRSNIFPCSVTNPRPRQIPVLCLLRWLVIRCHPRFLMTNEKKHLHRRKVMRRDVKWRNQSTCLVHNKRLHPHRVLFGRSRVKSVYLNTSSIQRSVYGEQRVEEHRRRGHPRPANRCPSSRRSWHSHRAICHGGASSRRRA